MENTIQNQWSWLKQVQEGVRIIAKGGIWIRPMWTKNALGIRHAESAFMNVHTGEMRHLSYLADLEKPPRIECRPSPFSS